MWRKNVVRWTFLRSWEVKRPNTRVFQLKEWRTRRKTSKKKKVSFNFLILEKNVLEIYKTFACWWWSFWFSAYRIQIVLCFGRCNSQLRRSHAGFRCNAMFILCYFAVGWKSKSTLFLWQKDVAGLFVENRNHGLAWSQSGNNKTIQTLLSLFKSYFYQGREFALQSEDSHL